MRITHMGHSAVLVEVADQRILIDPGNLTSHWHDLVGLDAIMVTHQHPDHVDPERFPQLMDANPGAITVAEPTAKDVLGLPGVEPLRDGQEFKIGPLSVVSLVGEHAVIHADLPSVANAGLVFRAEGEPTLFHPGDSLTKIPEGVDILLIPAYGPWAAVKETIEFTRAIGADDGYLIHDELLSDAGRTLIRTQLTNLTKTRITPWG